MKKIGYVLTVGLLMAGVAQAGTINWVGGGTNSDWLTTANWSPNLPGATAIDTALIIQGDVATVGSTVTSPFAIDITMRNGGQLTIGADMTTLRNLRIGTSDSIGFPANSVTHNSGTLTSSGLLELGTDPDNSSSVWKVGSSAAKLNLSSSVTLGAAGELQFTVDSSGAGKITSGGTFTIDSVNSKLTLDLSAFSGTGSFDLVTFDSVVGSFAAGKITGLTGLSGGRTASITYDSNSMNLTVIPEPATIGMLGLGTLITLLVRRMKS